ncbi:hypothetical protein GCM10008955_08650 [Deinococcus malanensis]|uniref:Transposase DDE domain-containing protein n=1 Tax=Deinococcus malanensis TaxID=1706855 RepID=A0ABQ2EMY9_9DEIO|nr:hypothetical protein GCM10008955_08650 [Deinococcus malanensis]
MGRPNLTLLPLSTAVTMLGRWIAPHIPLKLLHPHEKILEAELLAVALLQKLYNVPYPSRWWRFLKLNHFPDFPSEPQARIRLARLTPVVQQLATEVQFVDFIAIDSEPLLVSTFKRAPRCKFHGARHGFSTTGPVYGFKLHGWCTLKWQDCKIRDPSRK